MNIFAVSLTQVLLVLFFPREALDDFDRVPIRVVTVLRCRGRGMDRGGVGLVAIAVNVELEGACARL
jgi:hypothetical protein